MVRRIRWYGGVHRPDNPFRIVSESAASPW